MMKNNELEQGNHSVALQNTGSITGNININAGLSLADVTELFNTMFSSKYPTLIEEARKESYKSISEFAFNLHQKMSGLTEQHLTEKIEKKFASADFQTLLFRTVEQVGIKTDNAPKELLSNLLMEKLTQDNEDYYINYVIDVLKYMNKNQINFILFLSIHNLITNHKITINGINKELDISAIYKEIDSQYLLQPEKRKLKNLYSEEYKSIINNFLSKILVLNPMPVDIELLSSTVLLGGGGIIHTEDVLGNFKESLNKEEYSWEELFLDFPLYKQILEMFGGSLSEPEFFIRRLNGVGIKIVSSIDLNNF